MHENQRNKGVRDSRRNNPNKPKVNEHNERHDETQNEPTNGDFAKVKDEMLNLINGGHVSADAKLYALSNYFLAVRIENATRVFKKMSNLIEDAMANER